MTIHLESGSVYVDMVYFELGSEEVIKTPNRYGAL